MPEPCSDERVVLLFRLASGEIEMNAWGVTIDYLCGNPALFIDMETSRQHEADIVDDVILDKNI